MSARICDWMVGAFCFRRVSHIHEVSVVLFGLIACHLNRSFAAFVTWGACVLALAVRSRLAVGEC